MHEIERTVVRSAENGQWRYCCICIFDLETGACPSVYLHVVLCIFLMLTFATSKDFKVLELIKV